MISKNILIAFTFVAGWFISGALSVYMSYLIKIIKNTITFVKINKTETFKKYFYKKWKDYKHGGAEFILAVFVFGAISFMFTISILITIILATPFFLCYNKIKHGNIINKDKQ